MKPLALLLLCALSAPHTADAQQIYRCGNSYSQMPCPGGAMVEAEDDRSTQQKREAETLARRDTKLADEMARTREQLQAKAAPAIHLSDRTVATHPTPTTHKPLLYKPDNVQRSGEFFTAIDPTAKKKPKKSGSKSVKPKATKQPKTGPA